MPYSADPSPIEIFDRRALRARRGRRAARAGGGGDQTFLFDEIAERLLDRLDDVNRAFPRALDLGARHGSVARALGGRGRVETLVTADLAAAAPEPSLRPAVVTEPDLLPFAPGSFDLVLSNLAMHWVNDLPGALLQLRHILRPDGLLLAAMFGGETLTELRQALLAAEIAEENGGSPRVSPFAELRDAAGLLQRAGFTMPVADADTLTVTYPDALALMRDLRGMGEANALVERRRSFTRRATLARAAAEYHERFAELDGRIRATFQVIYLTGWAPHPEQPKPLRPGSAAARLADALGAAEQPAGDKAGGGRADR
jgi:SAM-dependent methyltransferase